MEKKSRSVFKILAGKRPLRRPRYGWEDNIIKDHKEGGIGLIRPRIGIVGESL